MTASSIETVPQLQVAVERAIARAVSNPEVKQALRHFPDVKIRENLRSLPVDWFATTRAEVRALEEATAALERRQQELEEGNAELARVKDLLVERSEQEKAAVRRYTAIQVARDKWAHKRQQVKNEYLVEQLHGDVQDTLDPLAKQSSSQRNNEERRKQVKALCARMDSRIDELDRELEKERRNVQDSATNRKRIELLLDQVTRRAIQGDATYQELATHRELALERLVEALAEGEVLEQLRAELNRLSDAEYTLTWTSPAHSGLGSTRDTFIVTPSLELAEGSLRRLDGASIGISGPRGVGKTTLLDYLCERATHRLGAVSLRLSAPVDYEPRDYILYAYSQLCLAAGARDDVSTGVQRTIPPDLNRARYLRLATVLLLAFGGVAAAVYLLQSRTTLEVIWWFAVPCSTFFLAQARFPFAARQPEGDVRRPKSSRELGAGHRGHFLRRLLRTGTSAVRSIWLTGAHWTRETREWVHLNVLPVLLPCVLAFSGALAPPSFSRPSVLASVAGGFVLCMTLTIATRIWVPSDLQLMHLQLRSTIRQMCANWKGPTALVVGYALLSLTILLQPASWPIFAAVALVVLSAWLFRPCWRLGPRSYPIGRRPPSQSSPETRPGDELRKTTRFSRRIHSDAGPPPITEASSHGGDGSLPADEATRRLREIRYQQTYTTAFSTSAKAGATLGPVSGEASRQYNAGEAVTRHPQTFPEIVSDFREFLMIVSTDFPVVLAIDELDKMAGTDATRLLNGVKSIFGVPGCFFLVSVSEDAVVEFERRGAPFRTVYDSSFDEIVRVERFRYQDSLQYCSRRLIGLPRPFALIAHVMSSGVPRELLRVLRSMVPPSSTSLDLAEVVEGLLRSEAMERKRAVVHELLKADVDILPEVQAGHTAEIVRLDLMEEFTPSLFASWSVLSRVDSPLVRRLFAELMAFQYFRHVIRALMRSASDAGLYRKLEGESGGSAIECLTVARQLIGVSPYTSVTQATDFVRSWLPGNVTDFGEVIAATIADYSPAQTPSP